MLREARPCLVILLALGVITGAVYPLAVTALAQLAFPRQANGSVVERHGAVVGSSLIGQPFDDPGYFWSRPSATATVPYNAAASSGSNLGPTNPALLAAVAARVAALRTADPDLVGPIPVDLVTASASGLDPDISPAAAAVQVRRVARARALEIEAVQRLVAGATSGRDLGLFGEPRVNVLALNLALDAACGGPPPVRR
jgi:K+-transporting ATPase ATPase C chain